MTEKDFVFGWLLASRAGSNSTHWTFAKTKAVIENGKEVYSQVEKEYQPTKESDE